MSEELESGTVEETARVGWISHLLNQAADLQVRGLVEKVTNPADSRSFLYRPTFQLLTHLGVSKIEELPDYEEVKSELVALTGVLGQDSSLIPNP